jgi:L-2-hydroxyglutarate oxidase LhgO
MLRSARPASPDFVVVGGGIIGLTVALEIRRRWSQASVTLLEKENECGQHASGRNSGVLHAGFYYTADSLKARFSRVGNRELTEYCRDRKLPLDESGKVVVTRREEEIEALEELFRRAAANGVSVERVTERELRGLEPTARTVQAALYSPTTASVSPGDVMVSLARDASLAGVRIRTGVTYLGHRGNEIRTSAGPVSAGYVINAAGLYSDAVAHDFGFGREYSIVPFRGLYLEYRGAGQVPRHHVYPVPSLENPFLGVHWTRKPDGGTTVGPTAIPALWREHYRGLRNLRLQETLDIAASEIGLWLRDSAGFRSHAWNEVRKRSKRHLLSLARRLVGPETAPGDWSWGRPGVRAQLMDNQTGKLEMDFICAGDDRSFHILNSVSPAFTCAFPFARHVVNEIGSLLPLEPKRSEPVSLGSSAVSSANEYSPHG